MKQKELAMGEIAKKIYWTKRLGQLPGAPCEICPHCSKSEKPEFWTTDLDGNVVRLTNDDLNEAHEATGQEFIVVPCPWYCEDDPNGCPCLPAGRTITQEQVAAQREKELLAFQATLKSRTETT